jgi:hypothetical protein
MFQRLLRPKKKLRPSSRRFAGAAAALPVARALGRAKPPGHAPGSALQSGAAAWREQAAGRPLAGRSGLDRRLHRGRGPGRDGEDSNQHHELQRLLHVHLRRKRSSTRSFGKYKNYASLDSKAGSSSTRAFEEARNNPGSSQGWRIARVAGRLPRDGDRGRQVGARGGATDRVG